MFGSSIRDSMPFNLKPGCIEQSAKDSIVNVPQTLQKIFWFFLIIFIVNPIWLNISLGENQWWISKCDPET